jgi:5-carboxyvanillate decarboxylase
VTGTSTLPVAIIDSMSRGIPRRTFVGAAAAGSFAVGVAPQGERETSAPGSDPPMRRIATEEAFAIPEQARALAEIGRTNWDSLDVELLRILYTTQATPVMVDIHRRLLDLEGERLRIMDRDGVAMHVLSLTSPGVQMFDADTATAMATLANDRLAEVIRRHPTRFAGLASLAPQDPARAVLEMERAINQLGLNGFVLNSHTGDEYLDQQKYWPILEAAEGLGTAIYLHPRSPSRTMQGPLTPEYNLHAAMWGYAVETATHALRIMMSGLLDRFPRLMIVLGHMGELIPLHLWRIDFMSTSYRQRVGLRLTPTEYFRRNFMITTSGVQDPLALRYCVDKLGADRVMWAIDYPYHESAPAVAFLDDAPISHADKEKIFHANAERVFRIRA